MENKAAATARAFTTYSLVPYLGILFSTGALVMNGLAILRPARVTTARDYTWLGLSLLILFVQILLWWILYKVPQWAQGL